MNDRGQNLDSAARRQELTLARRTFPDFSQLVWRLLADGADLDGLGSEGVSQAEIKKAARQALQLNSDQFRRKRSGSAFEKRYPRACHKWSRQEELRLLELYSAGKTLREIARVVERHPRAVQERLQRLKSAVCS